MHRQKGQVYYFSLRHLGRWSKWLSEVGEFHTFFECVLYFVPFCTMQPFSPALPFFWLRENGREKESRGRAKNVTCSYSIWALLHSSNSSLPAARLHFHFSLNHTKTGPTSPPLHPVVHLWTFFSVQNLNNSSDDQSFPPNLVFPPVWNNQ